MTSKLLQVSQEELLAHSEIKVRLLKYYLEAYISILGYTSFIDRIYMFDLFCGPGIYKNKGKGSPIILLEEVKRLKEISDPRIQSTNINCFFNDLDNDRISMLKENVVEHELFKEEWGNINYSTLDYKSSLPIVNETLKNNPNSRGFVFIDPYGYKDIEINDIVKITESKKVDVLLFLPVHYLFRFRNSKTQPQSLKSFLKELNIDENDSSSNSVEFIEKVTTGFKTKLSSDFFVDSFLIERGKNKFFSVFFFSNNILGFEKMIEAKWKIDKVEGKGWTPNAERDLFNQFDDCANTIRLRDLIRNFIGNNIRTNSELYEFTLRSGFKPKHANEVLRELQSGDKISVQDRDGNLMRKNSFYLNYKDFSKNPSKAIFKLK